MFANRSSAVFLKCLDCFVKRRYSTVDQIFNNSAIKRLSCNKSFGGHVLKFEHQSQSTKTAMKFSCFVPAKLPTSVPILFWLSGLTCNEDNFITKAGVMRSAARYKMLVVCPDTSPRGANIPGEDEAYDFGTGAGFYVDATQAPWNENYNMYSYVTKELPDLFANVLFASTKVHFAISGHSMGGHGALVSALRNPNLFNSVSAFAPICNPSQCAWGQKALRGYLGDDEEAWKEYDATELIKKKGNLFPSILIDQGTSDEFLEQLKPINFRKAAASVKQKLVYNDREAYDHSYFFIASFIDEHVKYHYNALEAKAEL